MNEKAGRVSMKLRLALESDVQAIWNIYAKYINTPITFEYELPTLHEFTNRWKQISHTYPYIVCEEAGTVIGYAYANRQRERAAYQWNVELSIYIDPSYTAKGIGRLLLTSLIELLKLQKMRTIYGCITLPNDASVKLHESFGFQRIGVYHNTGYKCGIWHDVVWYEKQIMPYNEPNPLIPFCEYMKTHQEDIQSCLNPHNL